MDSILTSIKKLLGIAEDYDHFDPDIIMHINSVFMILTQLGVGPVTGFSIEDETSTWTDFTENMSQIEAVKSYIAMKVRLMFDPPTNSAHINAINSTIAELESRLNMAVDSGESI